MKKLTLLFLLCAAALFAQESTKLDSLFLNLVNYNKAMGSYAISKNGKEKTAYKFGFAALAEDGSKINYSRPHYRIGSVSKMFTAVMIFQLVEEKKISRQQKISTWFPKVPNAEKISIDMLLNHRSGLHNVTADSTYTTWLDKPQSMVQMLARFEKEKTEFEPGSTASYSNTNYILLGFIIEKVTGKPYAENLKKRITSKLALKDTYYGGKIDTKKSEARSYSFESGKWKAETETDMSIPHGAGAVVSTPQDLCKFITGLFTGRLISDSSLKNMTAIQENYGRGIFKIPFYEYAGYGHTGAIDGFVCNLAWFPHDSTAIAFCANAINMGMNQILICLLSDHYKKPYTVPDFKTVEVSETVLNTYAGMYASEDIPLKVLVSSKGKKLIIQATGQDELEMEAKSDTEFTYDRAGIRIIFNAPKKFILKQGGGEFHFEQE